MEKNTSKTAPLSNNPFVKLPNSSRFRAGLIGGVKSIKTSVYLNGLDGNLLTKVDCDSEDEAKLLMENINEQLDAVLI